MHNVCKVVTESHWWEELSLQLCIVEAWFKSGFYTVFLSVDVVKGFTLKFDAVVGKNVKRDDFCSRHVGFGDFCSSMYNLRQYCDESWQDCCFVLSSHIFFLVVQVLVLIYMRIVNFASLRHYITSVYTCTFYRHCTALICYSSSRSYIMTCMHFSFTL